MQLGFRLIHCSWLAVLCVGGIHLTQAWSGQINAERQMPLKRAIETNASSTRGATAVDDALNLPVVTMGKPSTRLAHWLESIPDQGRPAGRLRGGGSR